MEIAVNYDVIVVGGGHAGCEAALAAARMGASTLMITMNMDHIAQMPCNPAVGGIAKGQVVREVDALGGEMGHNTDAAMIQFRMLNHTKGPAVWSPRAQCDKVIYQYRMKHVLELQENLEVHQAEIVDLVLENGQIVGVRTQFDDVFRCKSLVISSGTFLQGQLHYGDKSFPGGRAGDQASTLLSQCLANTLELEMGRLKTGTPPRILASTIDFNQLQMQDGEVEDATFSYFPEERRQIGLVSTRLNQLPCYIGKTTPRTAEIIRENLDRAPMFSGRITGQGTRYCPSIEDKVVRFAHHETHQLFIEPEGIGTQEYYINGISTSLPSDVQWAMIQSIPGFENARMSRYAYAVEYDMVLPHQLTHTLALKKYPNLFLAGQINGTSGYEEAAGQGVVAGANAARHAANLEGLIIGRDEAYIGVMIDDLITKDIFEPYRLFTSRSEYRLILRQDNADRRLTELARKYGMISDARYQLYQTYEAQVQTEVERLQKTRVQGKRLWDILRPLGDYSKLDAEYQNTEIPARVQEQVAIEAKYEGYIQREMQHVNNLNDLEKWRIPKDFDYAQIVSLKNEAREKLEKFRPADLGQASRIDGVTPSEVGLLQVFLKRIKRGD